MPEQPKTLDRILITLKMKKPQGALTRSQAMEAWPVRNPALKTQTAPDGTVVIEVPRRKDWMGGVLGFMFSVPESRPLQLDEVGSFVWERCDGENTVNDIAAALVKEYKLNRREVEVSLTKYLQDLARRGLVAFAVPREVAEAAGLTGEDVRLDAPETTTPAEKRVEAPAEAAEEEREPGEVRSAFSPLADFDLSSPPERAETDQEVEAVEEPETAEESEDLEPTGDETPERQSPETTPAEEPRDDQEHPGGI